MQSRMRGGVKIYNSCEDRSNAMLILWEAQRRAVATAVHNRPPVGTKGVSLPRAGGGGHERPRTGRARCDHTSSAEPLASEPARNLLYYSTRRLIFRASRTVLLLLPTLRPNKNIKFRLYFDTSAVNTALCPHGKAKTNLPSKVFVYKKDKTCWLQSYFFGLDVLKNAYATHTLIYERP